MKAGGFGVTMAVVVVVVGLLIQIQNKNQVPQRAAVRSQLRRAPALAADDCSKQHLRRSENERAERWHLERRLVEETSLENCSPRSGAPQKA